MDTVSTHLTCPRGRATFASALAAIIVSLLCLGVMPTSAPAAVTVEKVQIPVPGGYLDGTIMRPGPGTHPAVVMAPGLGNIYEGNVSKFARRFVEAGMVTVGFNYRHFGLSTGKPRRVIDPRKQHNDWRAAIAFTKGLAGVDSERIALWGTSMSGGHVLFLGTEYPELRAVVAQAPQLDGRGSAARQDPRTFAGIAALTALDLASAVVGGAPVQVPLVGRPGTAALMTAPGSWEYFVEFSSKVPGYVNAVPARSSLNVIRYSPILKARQSKVPTQITVANQDLLTPPGPARKLAAEIGAELHDVDAGHFGIYDGPVFESIAGWQIAYLRERLGLAGA